MVGKKRRGDEEPSGPRRRELVEEGKIGTVLLDLRSALLKAERCRRTLTSYGLSQRRWLEIVKDIDPNLRFMARPQVMDAIVTYLESRGQAVDAEQLVNDLAERGTETLERIRQAVRLNLQNGKLEAFPQNKIGLPGQKLPASS